MIDYLTSYASALSAFVAKHQKTALNPTSKRGTVSVDWVLPRQVAVGSLPQQSDVSMLREAGLKAVLALCSEHEGQWPMAIQDAFSCHRVSMPDSHHAAPMTPHQIAIAVHHIHHCLQQNRPVFVHCLAGVERSPIICTAYLCRHHHYPLWESLNWVKTVHPESLPNPRQLKALKEYLAICQC